MEISDLFIQSTSGLPYKANCYGGEYCRMNNDHALITGFFAAINSFKGEFNQEAIDLIKFDKLTLVLEQLDEFLVIIAIDDFDQHTNIRHLAKEVINEFFNKFGEKLKVNNYAKLNSLPEFDVWLDEKIGKVIQGDLSPLLEKKKKGFLNKLKSRLGL